MKSRSPRRIAAIMALGCALAPTRPILGVKPQDDASATAVLLGRARTLEQRGRLDLAKQDWSQVLQADPNDAEALAGLVRAARAEGRAADAERYLARLRASHPNSPELARLQTASSGSDTAAALGEAAKLARAGDPRGAMTLYRRVYGFNPPPGAPALRYYETEGETPEGRPQAIASLRALVDRFPADARYQVALGRLLLGSPRTHAEGRTLLEALPGNAEAVAALHGQEPPSRPMPQPAEVASATPPAPVRPVARPEPSAVPASRPEPRQAEQETRAATAAASTNRPERPAPKEAGTRTGAAHSVLVEAPAAPYGRRTLYLAEEQAAFTALNEHRDADAEQIFRSVLSRDPRDARALAGMGYLRESAGDLRSAVSFFEQAQESGDRSLALTRAIVNAQFELAVKQAGTDRLRGDLPAAEAQYRAALRERPNDPDALDGLGGTLLQSWRFGDAISVYEKLTRVRPLDPGAWRGLVVAEASAGREASALAADAQVPAAARAPLLRDASYQRALSVAREATVARVEAPPLVHPSPAPPPPEPAATAPPAPQPVTPPPAEKPPAGRTPEPGRAKQPENVPRPAVVAGVHPPSAPLPPKRSRNTPPPPAHSAPALNVPARVSGPNEAETLELADRALVTGRDAEAATLFRALVARLPDRAEGWRGLLLALHAGGHDGEAMGVLERVPASARAVLDHDATYQAAAGSVLLADNQPNEALRAFARAQDVFSSQRLRPPLELVMETARLLSARGDDENLYRELMYLGERTDLTDTRRAEVQMIWTHWAVRRARALAAAGDERRAVTLLNAAATAFAGNQEVLHAVAAGYAGISRPWEAVALYRTMDLQIAPASTIEAAMGAAVAARDFRTAETWSRLGLQRFPADATMVNAAAELAGARGRERRALELSEQARALAPAQNPGQVLATELKEAPAGQGWGRRLDAGGQLGVLLAPGSVTVAPPGRPYLPVTGPPAPGLAVSGTKEPPSLEGYDEPSR